MDRIKKIQKSLDDWEVDLLIVDHPIDLFYLIGEVLSLGRLMISKQEVVLYVDGRYYELCKKKLLIPVALLEKERDFFSLFEGKRIGFDAFFTTYDCFLKFSSFKHEWVPLSKPLQLIRSIKEPLEIEALKRAANLCAEGFDFLLSLLKKGVTEKQLSIELEVYWRKKGGERLSFPPQIAFGKNSAYPHSRVGDLALEPGDIVLIDIGVVVNHYHSDMTRTIFFGEPQEELKKIHEIINAAQSKAFALCKPGTPIAELDHIARSYITESGYGDQFLHSLGHGVGLEIHEEPYIRKKAVGELKEGMVITIEPGIYLVNQGGVRLEDTIVITSNGFENLTHRPWNSDFH
ncbi:MAG: Xaa-Pro peptidase family protein [Chlamydiales bacterium]